MNQTGIVACIFVVALLVRVSALLTLPPPPLDTSAQIAYWGGAQILTHGKGFSDPSYPVYAPPGYAIFIATCLKLFGADLMPVKIVQCVLDSLSLVVIFVIMKDIFGTQTGLFSAVLMAIYPFSIYLSISVASEPLFTFLLSIFALLACYAIRFQNIYYFCGAGVLLALATLTRATTQYLPIIIFFPVMFISFKKRTKDLLRAYGAFIVAFAIVMSPWALRNYAVLSDFVPVGTAGGWVFLQGSTEIFFTSDALEQWPVYYETLRPPKGLKPSEIDRFNMRAGLENYQKRLQNDPVSIFSFLATKFLRLWYAGESGRNDAIIILVNLPIYSFALAGLLIAWHRRITLVWVPFTMVTYFVIVHWASLPLFRYLMPVMPYLVGFAAFTMVSTMGILHSYGACKETALD